MSELTTIKAGLSAFGAALGMVLMAGSGVQAHGEHAMVFSHHDAEIQVMGERNNRRYRVGDRVFGRDDLTEQQWARLDAIERRLEAAEKEFEASTEGLDEWAEQMDKVAAKIELAADGIDDIEIDIDRTDGKISHREFEQMARAMSEKMRVFEQQIAVHEKEMRAIEAEMPEINQVALNRLEAEAEQLKVTLLQIVEELDT
ncbi:MAG: hypothetical protein DHS20C11_02400 [Lysobacteraceae bacterium]|nr:MAG: hypothetical protein DHS20C11_02400 [Xanthomonadaceae bacterium]